MANSLPSGLSARHTFCAPSAPQATTSRTANSVILPLGVMRVRERGSAAGHNGARSISGALRSDEWARIRIGVGSNGEPEEAFRRGKDYLLTPLRKRDLAALDEVLERVAQAVEVVAAKGISAAMNEFNRRDTSPAE